MNYFSFLQYFSYFSYTYLLVLIISIYVIIILYIKIKYHFWSRQPVFHYYNLLYWIKPSGIINEDLPIVNKYCNFKNIKTSRYDKLTTLDKQFIVNFLKTHYLRSKYANYLPTQTSFSAYFENNTFDSYISIYTEDKLLMNYNNQSQINSKEIISTMTSRPLYLTLGKDVRLPVYYIDNLCVHSTYRKKNIAPQMIQTHEWYQRQNNKKIKISLFKREGELLGIVPLVAYNTYAYRKLTVYKLKNPQLSIILITKQTVHLLMDFIKENIKKFDCTITCHIGNLVHLINCKIIYPYVLKMNDDIIACYFLKNTFSNYHKQYLIELTSSISNCPYAEMFYTGFTNAYYQICHQMKTKMIIIENISHNNAIVDRIARENVNKNKNKLLEISPTAFFLYNYSTYSVKPEKVFCVY